MQLDDQFIDNLLVDLRAQKATDVVREGLTILNWAVQERKKNRVILSADSEGKNVVRLAMPGLDFITTAS